MKSDQFAILRVHFKLTDPNSNKNSKKFSLKNRLENNSIINLQISMNNNLLLKLFPLPHSEIKKKKCRTLNKRKKESM